ncbi:MAG: hypothetical protein ABIC96_00645 [Patescibacteria group bacterium]
MQKIISKLNMLKSVHPSESWVVETRKEVLSEAPVFVLKPLEYNSEHIYTRKSIFNLSNLFTSKLAVSFSALVFVLFGGFSAVYASKSSLPGDTLYAIKMANESVTLAVASDSDKGKIEIQQVGNRLEELAKVSQNISDSKQEEKINNLYNEIDVKSKKVDGRLTKSSNNGQTAEKVSIAKVANSQYEKYGEALAKITESMPDSMKEKVSPKANNALASAEKVNFSSLMVIVENNASENSVSTSSNNDEIRDKLKKMIEREKGPVKTTEENKPITETVLPATEDGKIETALKTVEINTSATGETNLKDSSIILTKEELLAGAEKSLESGDLAGAAKNIAAAKEIGEKEKVDDVNEIDNAGKINENIMPIPVFEDNKIGN